jgi:hypothetical protein
MKLQHNIPDSCDSAWPWLSDTSVSEVECNWWEFLRMQINTAECVGAIDPNHHQFFLDLLTEMFHAGMRSPGHLLAAHLCFFADQPADA